jgi:hypothetical protein
MSAPDYYLTDSIVIEYHGGGEIVNRMRVDRSRHPRWATSRGPGQSLKDWIEENEELQTRIVYEEGNWNVRPWEAEFYTTELADLNLTLECVFKISRVVSYKIK